MQVLELNLFFFNLLNHLENGGLMINQIEAILSVVPDQVISDCLFERAKITFLHFQIQNDLQVFMTTQQSVDGLGCRWYSRIQ